MHSQSGVPGAPASAITAALAHRPSRAAPSAWRALQVAALVCLAGCQSVSTTRPGTVGVDRSQTMLVSSAELDAAAASEYQKILAAAREKGILNTNAKHVRRVPTVAK